MTLRISTIIAMAMSAAASYALTLDADKAVALALDNSEEMKIAANSLEQARINRRVAVTAYLPNFSGSATGMWRMPDTKTDIMSLSMRGVYMAGISVTQPVFAGGKIVAANRLAAIGEKAAIQQQRLSRINVIAGAETSYWNYVAVIAKVRMMESYRALVDTAYNQTLAAVNAGMATRNDLLRIEARRSEIIYRQEQAISGRDLCRMALCNAIGLPAETPVEVSDSVIDTTLPDGLFDYDLDSRPELQLMKADIAAKEQQVRMTRADFLPQLGLMAGWSAYGGIKLDMMTQAPDGSYVPVSDKIKGNGWNIMLSLNVPLFHWGEGVKKVRHARIEVENARLTLQRNTRNLDLQVRQAISNLQTGLELLRSAETALTQADASLKSTSESYSLGLAPITDLLDAQSQWHTSKSNLIEARAQLRIFLIDYKAATATL